VPEQTTDQKIDRMLETIARIDERTKNIAENSKERLAAAHARMDGISEDVREVRRASVKAGTATGGGTAAILALIQYLFRGDL